MTLKSRIEKLEAHCGQSIPDLKTMTDAQLERIIIGSLRGLTAEELEAEYAKVSPEIRALYEKLMHAPEKT